ncbi:MAG: 4-diphosphocytidyl-2-C-methyl-D-erythritol kinase [Chloroflexi bacterium]|jgi:4-diphosphocytidyl-2-C-methyl-D-erythritol kinase|nr:MAG: 4-diphosphocytidyl-2-C-methyl-D-erythritol kinase [Chloroflexota bacterium]
MTALTLKAPAKINLTLEVLRKRPDGFHEVALLLQTISLFDTLTLEEASEISLECTDASLATSDNLVVRAAHLLQETTGSQKGVRMYLKKEIPIAAGLGGGSSDAAGALQGLNQLWELGLSHSELEALGATLGSDVPFFLNGGTSLCLGRGEQVEPLPAANLPWIVLLCPDILLESKTAALYARLPADRRTRGALTFKLAGRIRSGGDIPPDLLFNAFEDEALHAFPGLADYRSEMLRAGAETVHLSGTGPSLYALFSGRPAAVAARALLGHARGWRAYLVEAWQPDGAAPVSSR